MPLPWSLRALSSRNFRLFFAGQIVSLVGSWVTTATNAWLIYQLSGRRDLLGLAAFLAQVPAFVLAPFAGVWIDRWNLRRVLIVTQVLSLIESAALASLCLLYLQGHLSPHAVVSGLMACMLAQGVINSLDLPARQSFGVQMVDAKEHLANAVALNSTMVNVSRFIGPALAGAIIAAGGKDVSGAVRGAAWCYAIDVASYVGVIYALVIMRPREVERAHHPHGARHAFKEGLLYVRNFPALRTALLLLCVTSFFGVSLNSQLASIAPDLLGARADGYGLLVGGIGVGATISALYLATRKTTHNLPVTISYASLAFGLSIIAFSTIHRFGLALALAPVIGGAMILQSAGTNTLCQTLAHDTKRGRVMAFFTMSFMGMAPLGAITLGTLTQHLNPARSPDAAIATTARAEGNDELRPADHGGTRYVLATFGAIVSTAALVARPKLKQISRTMREEAPPPVVATAGDEPEPETDLSAEQDEPVK